MIKTNLIPWLLFWGLASPVGFAQLHVRPLVPVAIEEPESQLHEVHPEDPQPTKAQEKDAIEDEDPTHHGHGDVFVHVQVKKRSDSLIGIADSAAEGATGGVDLSLRPILRPGEVLETVPGMIITQHSGAGKANQYFLRGFNLDHGTDFQISVDHMNVNMPTHGHGQGYADLNFLIPELVEVVRFRKGPYYAEQGDFSSAGASEIHYVNHVHKPVIHLTGGSYDYGRLLYAQSFDYAESDTLLAAVEVGYNNGPWERGDAARKLNGLLKFSRGDEVRGFTVSLMGYDADWRSSDQIPERAIASGQVDRFGLIDPDLGGSSSRYSVSLDYHVVNENSMHEFNAYLLNYDLSLFSNFTYHLDFEDEGDQFEQLDDRVVLAAGYNFSWNGAFGSVKTNNEVGFQASKHSIDNGLFRTNARNRFATVREDSISQLQVGAYFSSDIRFNERFRSVVGLRADMIDVDVESDLAVNSDTASDSLISPKLSNILKLGKRTEAFLNLGYGFHSNDARGMTIAVDPNSGEAVEAVPALVRSKGIDLGISTSVIPNLVSAFTIFALESDSELVFVGDGGGTEAGSASLRKGIEWTNYYQINDRLAIELDATFTRPRFKGQSDEGAYIPGSVESTIAGGISFANIANYHGSLRLRHFGSAPLIEDNSIRSESSTLLNGRLGYVFSNGFDITLDIFNLADHEGNDIQYFYGSRMANETDEVEGLHVHPMEPRSARLTIKWTY